MKTGIELIADERSEHFTKHKRTIKKDIVENADNQLSYGAILLLKKDLFRSMLGQRPLGWDEKIWNKMYNKTRKERLIIAGALIAAEIDRIQNDKTIF